MQIYDISLPVGNGLPVWPGDPEVEVRQVVSMDAGAQANVSHVSMGVHTGTHVDAPHHFLNDGRTVDGLPLETLVGPCQVVQVPEGVGEIGPGELQTLAIPDQAARVLFKTGNSRLWSRRGTAFTRSFVAINARGARWLVDRGVQLVGVDYLSVAPFETPAPTHTVLLEAGVIIVEGLDLSEVMPGAYDLICLPLNILGAEGAPARAILMRD